MPRAGSKRGPERPHGREQAASNEVAPETPLASAATTPGSGAAPDEVEPKPEFPEPPEFVQSADAKAEAVSEKLAPEPEPATTAIEPEPARRDWSTSSTQQTTGREERLEAPPAQERRGSLVPGFIAGLVGGLIVVTIAYFMLAPLRDANEVFRGRLDTLDQRVGGVEALAQKQPPDLTPRIDEAAGAARAAGDRADAAGRDLAALAQQVAQLPKTQPDLGPLQEAIAGTQRNLGDLDSKVGTVGQDVGRLKTLLERGSALALVIQDLDRGLSTGASLEGPIAKLRQLAGDDETLKQAADQMEKASGAGITSVPDLSALLDKIQPTSGPVAGATAGTGNTGNGWLGSITQNVSKLVDVSGVDPAGDAMRQSLGEAKSRLAGGDLAGARDAVAPLARDNVPGAQNWLAAADNRLAALNAVSAARARLDAIVSAAR